MLIRIVEYLEGVSIYTGIAHECSIQGGHSSRSTLPPESLDDYASNTNPMCVVDVFIDELDLVNLVFENSSRHWPA